MEKAINNLKKWLIKKNLINKKDIIKMSKKDIKTCNIFRNNKKMGTGVINLEKQRIDKFKFLITKNSKKPVNRQKTFIKKPNFNELKIKRLKNKEFTIQDYLDTGKLKIKGLN